MKHSFAYLTALAAAVVIATTASAQQGVQRYVRFEQNGTIRWGHLAGETIHPLTDAPYLGGTMVPGESVALSSVKLKAPVDPKNSVMTAFNFRSHLGNAEPAAYPGLFIVPPGGIIGPDENVIKPIDTNNFHYEAEMVVVIGRRADNISVEEAGDYIFGVSAGNDGSARDFQAADTQWTRAKGTKYTSAVGPHLVTGLDYSNLQITGRLNGERVQGESTSDLLFSMKEMVAFISRYIILEPGDLVWTGTMGTTRQWPVGQAFEVEVEGVGILRNVLQEGAPYKGNWKAE
ncbi:MAG: fumarylacetoacetate hydrolase family protein [Gemmatimonadota bacterium]|nr:fumarylacetoacetate hydrolase family protein [Gemmatimonadota bacterium]